MNAPLLETIYHEIDTQGPLSFAGYMDLALYAPNLGYYSNPLRKFGKEGDFVTAPEISPLFARCLAKQIQQIFLSIPSSDLLEFGAGSGQMALDLLLELEKQDSLPQHYYILELSRQLRERQQALLSEKLPQFIHRVQWLDRLPEPGFNGVMIANEVLDAMPVHKFKLHASKNKDFDSVRELYVTHKNKQLRWQEGVPSSPLLIEKLQPIIQT